MYKVIGLAQLPALGAYCVAKATSLTDYSFGYFTCRVGTMERSSAYDFYKHWMKSFL